MILDFIFGFFGKFKLYIIIGLLAAAIVGLLYWYYTDTQNTIKEQQELIGQYKVAFETQKATIEQMQKQLQKIKEQYKKLQETNAATEERLLETIKKLQDLDLDNISDKDSQLLKQQINQMINDLFEQIKIISKHGK